jgi:hypothetical protein
MTTTTTSNSNASHHPDQHQQQQPKQENMTDCSIINQARTFFNTLANPPTPPPNYLSLTLGYTRQAIQPALHQWTLWSPTQRLLAACLILPLLAGPLLTSAVLAPFVLGAVAVGYVGLFGVETGQAHYRQAVKEHFGGTAVSLEAFRKQAEEQMRGSQVVRGVLSFASVAVSQLLTLTVTLLDYIIAVSYIYMYICY